MQVWLFLHLPCDSDSAGQCLPLRLHIVMGSPSSCALMALAPPSGSPVSQGMVCPCFCLGGLPSSMLPFFTLWTCLIWVLFFWMVPNWYSQVSTHLPNIDFPLASSKVAQPFDPGPVSTSLLHWELPGCVKQWDLCYLSKGGYIIRMSATLLQ